jgi:polyphosphate kinase
MPRNLDRRVETVAPVEGEELQGRLRSLMETCLRDERQAWELGSDGTWRQRTPRLAERGIHSLLLGNSWGTSQGGGAASLPTP